MTEEFENKIKEVHEKIKSEKEEIDVKVCEKSLNIAKDILNIVVQMLDGGYDYYKKRLYRGPRLESKYLGEWTDTRCIQDEEKGIGTLIFKYPKCPYQYSRGVVYKGYPEFLEASEEDIDIPLINEVLKREDIYLELSKDESLEYAEVRIIFPLSIFEPKFTPEEVREIARQKVLDRLNSHNISLK